MTYEEALNKMHNYGLDDEGEEAVEKLSEALEVLRILKKYPKWFGSLHRIMWWANYWGKGKVTVTESLLRMNDFPFSVDEFNVIAKWLEEEK